MKRIKKTLRRLNRRRKGIHFNTSDLASDAKMIDLGSLKDMNKKPKKPKKPKKVKPLKTKSDMKTKTKMKTKEKTKMKTNSPFGNLPQHTFNNSFEGMNLMSKPSSVKEPSFNLGSYKAPKDTFSKKAKKMKSSLSKGLSKRFKKPSKDLTQRLLASNAFIHIGTKKGRRKKTKRRRKKRRSKSRRN